MTAPLFDAMAAPRRAGSRCGCCSTTSGPRGIPGYQDMVTRLATTEIEWHPMLPIKPPRGSLRRPTCATTASSSSSTAQVGFTGSQNLTEPGYNKPKNHKAGREWVELMVRVQGPVVATLDAVFATDWYTETDEALRGRDRAGTPPSRRRGALHERRLPAGAERAGLRRREQPAHVHHADLLGARGGSR